MFEKPVHGSCYSILLDKVKHKGAQHSKSAPPNILPLNQLYIYNFFNGNIQICFKYK